MELVVKYNHLDRIKRLPAAADLIMNKAAHDTAGHWANDVRLDTGRYKGSIRATREKPGTSVAYSDVEYGPYNEMGTRFMEARPSARKAFERVAPSAKAALRKIEEALR